MDRPAFAERAETVLIAAMLVSIVLVAQRYSLGIYRLGLCLLVVSTFLQIAVGNVPKHFGFKATAIRVLVILAVIAAIFLLGIALVPYLAGLGR